jgi:hypothetical protein
MKITVRIPTETYAYVEVEFGSLEEYQSEYPKLAQVMVNTREKAKNLIKNEVPFNGKEFTKKK